jgi:hypothetical protein
LNFSLSIYKGKSSAVLALNCTCQNILSQFRATTIQVRESSLLISIEPASLEVAAKPFASVFDFEFLIAARRKCRLPELANQLGHDHKRQPETFLCVKVRAARVPRNKTRLEFRA